MSCTCTEEFEVIGKMKIGRNKVTCQECLDKQALEEAKRKEAEDTEKLIQNKIREQAISALKVEGKINSEGKLVKEEV